VVVPPTTTAEEGSAPFSATPSSGASIALSRQFRALVDALNPNLQNPFTRKNLVTFSNVSASYSGFVIFSNAKKTIA
jgi:hypothetical protein